MPAAFIWLIKGASAARDSWLLFFSLGSVEVANPREAPASTASPLFPPNRGSNHCFTGSHLPGMNTLAWGRQIA